MDRAGPPDERTPERELRIRAIAVTEAMRRLEPRLRPRFVDALIALAIANGHAASPEVIQQTHLGLLRYAARQPYEPRREP